MADPALVRESLALRRGIGRFKSHREWQASPEGPALAARVQRFLAPVRHWTGPVETSRRVAEPPRPSPESPSPVSPRPSTELYARAPVLRVAHWNVLHGNRYDGVCAALRGEPELAGADLLSLNEVDLGLARSGNRDVAFDLARELGMHAAWAALFLELEGGSDTPPEVAAQEQAEALFGLALLSRFPLGAAERVELESGSDFLFDTERKVGGLIALVVEVLRPGAPFHAVVTHLDVHRGPAVRALQMQAILERLPPGPAVLCGDLNTTTFARGNALRSAWAFGVLALAPPASLRRRLLQPYDPKQRPREPLFTLLSQAGFGFEAFNLTAPSLDLSLLDVREYRALPPGVRHLGQGLLRHAERRGRHRLDWIAARGFEPAPEHPPFALCQLMRGEAPLSDHAPIGCGLRGGGSG